MKRFKNILYYAEGETEPSTALSRSVELAKINQAQLTLMDVTENLSQSAIGRWLSGADLQSLITEQRQEQLMALAEPYLDAGLSIQIAVRSGTPFIEVIQAVCRSGYDLVVKTARVPTGTAELLFGSTDLHLLRKCPCPVWIDKPTKKRTYKKVMAAVDASDYNAVELNRLIMDLATSLASAEHSELHVAHVWRLAGESLSRYGRASLPTNQVDEMVEHAHKEHKRKLDALLSSYNLPKNHQVHLVKGWPATMIVHCAAEEAVDLLVMGTVGRTGIPGFLIGNTAENVLNAVRCSVLAVKPEGFTSPVQL